LKITNLTTTKAIFNIFQTSLSNSNSTITTPSNSQITIKYNETINIHCKTQKEKQNFKLCLGEFEILVLQKLYYILFQPLPQILLQVLIISNNITIINNVILTKNYQN
jgi:hypothetical protein